MSTLLQKEQRILSLWFPYLCAERILRQRLGRSWRSRPSQHLPLVISHRDSNAQRIAALDERAEALKLKRGMGIADARAMHPSIDVVEADAEADRRLLEGLADWCDRYTPLVAIDGEDGLFLDVTGCTHLFGGERAMQDEILTRFFQQGFDVRAGLASTPGAAWAAARFHGDRIVGGGEEEALLSPLPLSALRIAPETRASLESVGLRTAGAVMAAPRAPLARRFGATLLLRLDQALGRLDEAVSPRLPVAPLSVERHLAEPVVLTDDIERLVSRLAVALKADLERRGEGARALALLLFRVDGAVSRIAVGTSRPMREPQLIKKLFHERLTALEQNIDAGFGFDLVRLSVLSVAAFDMLQGDLTGEAADDDADIALFADRVRARLGEAAVLKPVVVESHLPERAVAIVPFAEAPQRRIPAKRSDRTAPPMTIYPPERPVRLFRSPEPIEVPATEIPEGPPMNFRWRRALYRVARAEGPERIAAEWWRQLPGEEEAPTRDYYRIEDSEGRRYWLYRQGLYSSASQAAPRWFMHGVFA
ncbi:DNA polymerase Y family protein [Mesorhizobium sp. M1C.F.Ca.ET.193.01.1.1]|nr:DNA polymerase Y family protein [Mesorhizobium sp. M1C.F.Ca.ET.210.01.1.1]TGQ65371.1 DNA polymerase Y family protein [Mesorhizobium sp. M1C.F.Ca.ET.212.01.1.1]TGQ99296.1 DNA polymerase Y family protein [Mesorhizobium sp. M1C.F.Ca.ET.204.01.1.1]TGR19627.1 DNA polymerase Y family protein [Mesorhizobium sp. M1C.F.Ca.ET.196.01.1.1]TGR42278.1 DNA polymerase Y family protein [Mesorhizobium sp. M1C.F.Ca.ET.195.01.1.1]TGR61393.1 DNA polymerase Y family protein [Mesorhizobium sp. M1C.F.Ca.ET.192.01.